MFLSKTKDPLVRLASASPPCLSRALRDYFREATHIISSTRPCTGPTHRPRPPFAPQALRYGTVSTLELNHASVAIRLIQARAANGRTDRARARRAPRGSS